MTRQSFRMHALASLLAMAITAPTLCQGTRTLPNFDRRTPIVLAVQNVGPSVVNIHTQDQVRLRSSRFFQPFQAGPRMRERSLGSGVIVHESGYVVTNEHVIRGADRILASLNDGRTLTADVINTNVDSDLAVLKLQGVGPFPTSELGDSSQLMVGETTIALGNPFGLDSSATDGILSGIGRSVHFRGRKVYEDFLQTSAIINPGNSGGPLLDINGRIIGINTAIDNRGPGIGYAIPIDRVKQVMTSLLDPELTKQAWLGLQPAVVNGVLLASHIVNGGPANAAGIRDGDRIVAVGSRPVATPFQFNVALQDLRPGQKVPLRIMRDGDVREASVDFTEIPLAQLLPDDRITLHGMSLTNLSEPAAAKLHLPDQIRGPLVLKVKEDSPAKQIGLEPGDIVVQVEAVSVRNLNDLNRALSYYGRRGHAAIKIYRESQGLMDGRISLR